MAGKEKKGHGSAPKSDDKSFAAQHWNAFERLSLQIIHDLYKEQPNEKYFQTSAQNDGGYDGMICFSGGALGVAELYKVLLEAKLRSNNRRDLPLSDFSKTVIIAVNTIADKVYISTNAYFSQETLKRLREFSMRTGLVIRTLDIEDITIWLQGHTEKQKSFEDQVLLKKLLSMYYKPLPEQKSLSLAYELEEGSVIAQAEALIGAKRKALCRELEQEMSVRNGALCVRGPMGSGKSIFIDQLAICLRAHYKNISHIDLTRFSDARGVFIKLLSFAWGEPADYIYAMSSKDLEDVTEYLGDSQFPEKSRNALIQMIHQSQKSFDENQRIHCELLLDYLRKIVPPVIRRVRSLIIVKNVRKATKNALDFLSSFIRILPEQPISFLIELEEQEEKCQYLLSELEPVHSYIKTADLPLWDDPAAHQFLTYKSPELSVQEQNRLIAYFGLLPLALSAGIDIFRQSYLGKTLTQIQNTLPERADIRFQYTLGYIDYIVKQFANRGGIEAQCGLVLLGIFDGTVKTAFLQETSAALGYLDPLPIFRMCSFTICTKDQIQVRHGTYTNSISKLDFVTKPFLSQILTQIEPKLELYFEDAEYIAKKRFDILFRNRDFERLRELWKLLAERHFQRDEQQLAFDVLKPIYDWWMENPSVNRLTSYEQYWLLLHLARTTESLYGAQAEELDYYLNQLDAVMNLADENVWPDGPVAMRCAKAEILHTKSQTALGRANYTEMLSYAETGIALIADDTMRPNREWLGVLWTDKALALKHLKNISVCIEFLESGKAQLADIKPFLHCYYMHLSSLYSVKNPRKAIQYFELVKSNYDSSLSQDLHADHNIASMYFILGEYKKALRLSGQVWLKAYENHIPIEEGRSDHLLGCIAWVQGELNQAYERFNDAYQLFQRHLHHTHLWPPLINLVTLCMEMGRIPEALKYTNDAIDVLLQYHMDSINHFDLSTPILPKMFVGILFLMDCMEQIDHSSSMTKKLLRRIKSPDVHTAYQDYVLPGRLDELLAESGYICGGKHVLKV